MACKQYSITVALALVLLVLVVGKSVGDAPGDESCPAQGEQQVNIRVLMDSMRYRTLLSESGLSSGAVWTSSDHWTSVGACASSAVTLCSDRPGKKWLQTQFINKILPAPDNYPVRIFVNVTLSSTCSGYGCNNDFELLVSHIISGEQQKYTGNGIRPDSFIPVPFIGTKQFYFDSGNTSSGFHIRLEADNVCVTVSRVLVYRYECPGHDRQPTGLARRPATQAPSTGSVFVRPYCAENSHFSDISNHNNLICLDNGTWLNGQAHCVCDDGYSNDRDADVCEASDEEELTDNNPPISTTILIPETPTDSSSSEEPTPSHSPSTSTTGTSTERTTSTSANTPLPDKPTTANETDSSTHGATLSVTLLAGVGGTIGAVTVMIFIVILIFTTIKCMSGKMRLSMGKEKDVFTADNVAYIEVVNTQKNQVYEEIPSVLESARADPHTSENIAYEMVSRFPIIPTAHTPAFSMAEQDSATTTS